jgi:hypothetical protein
VEEARLRQARIVFRVEPNRGEIGGELLRCDADALERLCRCLPGQVLKAR